MSSYNVDESVVKKPQHEEALTEEQADEWIKCANDIEYWMRTYVYVQGQNGKTLFNPRSYQQRIMDVMQNRFGIVLAGRQSGKSTCTGIVKLHKAIFFSDTKIGITSYKVANIKDYMDRIKYAYENLPWWMKTPVIEYNRHNIKFSNNSSIVSQVTKENTFRGITLTDIVCDELAFVKESVADEFWTSLLPSISAQGNESTTTLTIISTPNGTAGTFANIWFAAVNGINGFSFTKVEYDEIPGRDERFRKDMLGKMSLNKFLQEFCCEFISDKGTLINSRVLESLPMINPVEQIGDLRLFTNNFQGRKFVIACDPSEGVGQDYHAMQILDIESMEQAGEYQNNVITQTMFTKDIVRVVKMLFDRGAAEVYYSIEANAIGQGVMRLIENVDDAQFSNAMLVSDPNANKLGLVTTSKSKLKGCSELKDMIELHKLKLNSERLVTQLKFFVKQGNTFKAEAGTHDDLVMAMVLLMNMLEILANYEDRVFDAMNELSFEGQNEDEESWGIMF